MAQASLRRIAQPGLKLAVLTQPFAQVGWSVLKQFELIVLPGATTPTAFGGLPASTVLSAKSIGTALSQKGSATVTSSGTTKSIVTTN